MAQEVLSNFALLQGSYVQADLKRSLVRGFELRNKPGRRFGLQTQT